MKKVLILYKFLPQYRIEFFNKLYEDLKKNNIEIELIYGKIKESKKNDEVDIDWAMYRDNKTLNFFNTTLMWQPSLDYIIKSDLVIVENANSLMINYLLMIIRRVSNIKLAFWGHGTNLQSDSKSFKNKFKHLYSSQCDHWFVYTDGGKNILENQDVKSNIITVVNNSIDTKSLRKQYEECSMDEVEKLKHELGIDSKHVAIYSGSLYDIKKIDFLIESAKIIKDNISDFHLLIIGAGHDQHIVDKAIENNKWIHSIGSKFGKDRVVYFKLASIFMLPGAVGLAVLDAFATQTPLATTDIPLHGPEIEYLVNNYNGIQTHFELEAYASAVIDLFNDANKLELLKEGCIISMNKYTIENMVDRFVGGVKSILS